MANRAIALLVVALFATAHSQAGLGGALDGLVSGLPFVGGVVGPLLSGLGPLGGLPIVGALLGGCPANEVPVTATQCSTLSANLTCDPTCGSTALCINVCTNLLNQLDQTLAPILAPVTNLATGAAGAATGVAGAATGAASSATGAASSLTAPLTGALTGAALGGPLSIVQQLLGTIGGLVNTCVCQSGTYRNAAGTCVALNLCLGGGANIGATGGAGLLGLPLSL